MGDTKSYPLAEDAPCGNTFFKPESGPAMKQLENTRQDVGTPQNWGSRGTSNYQRGK